MMKMKNLHLIPVNIVDLVEKLNDNTVRENERNNYVLRIEAIRDYCAAALAKNHSNYKPVLADKRVNRTR